MFRSLSRKRRFGFTLVEVLVTTVVIGVLAAVVLPALAKQTSAADPARVASDLNNIKLGIEVFSNNLRPDFPGDLEDLVNAPIDIGETTSSTTDDFALDGARYVGKTKWDGPYVAHALAAVTTSADSSDTPWRAGANGFYNNDLKICNISAAADCTAATGGDGAFVAIKINGLSATEADDLDVLLDGAASSTAGIFRYSNSGTAAFYYAVPYTP